MYSSPEIDITTKPMLSGVPETLLIPLWARCAETSHPQSIIQDHKACELLAAIDYNFSQFENAWKTQAGVAIRTLILDKAVNTFIKQHPNALIINLGAGLDTRFFRVDNSQVEWVDIDLPEVIDLKETLISQTERYRYIASSIFELAWVEAFQEMKRPVLFIAEGVLMYFKQAIVAQLLWNLSSKFPESEMLLEIISPFVSKFSKWHDTVSKTEATFKWGIENAEKLTLLCSSLKILDAWNYLDYHPERWRWITMMTKLQALKRIFSASIVHVQFQSVR